MESLFLEQRCLRVEGEQTLSVGAWAEVNSNGDLGWMTVLRLRLSSNGLEEHPSDDENGSPSLVVVNGIGHELSFWDLQQLETSYVEPNNIEAAAPQVSLSSTKNSSVSVDPLAEKMIEDDSGHDSVLSPPQSCWQYHSGSHN